MAILEVVKYPAAVLHKRAETVVDINDARKIVQQLFEVAERQTWGKVVGLAAPQIGISKAVFIALGDAYINPVIIQRSLRKHIHEEGCYSLDNNRFNYPVSRSESVMLSWTDTQGKRRTQRLQGLQAQVVQHEYDHLLGKLCNEAKP